MASRLAHAAATRRTVTPEGPSSSMRARTRISRSIALPIMRHTSRRYAATPTSQLITTRVAVCKWPGSRAPTTIATTTRARRRRRCREGRVKPSLIYPETFACKQETHHTGRGCERKTKNELNENSIDPQLFFARPLFANPISWNGDIACQTSVQFKRRPTIAYNPAYRARDCRYRPAGLLHPCARSEIPAFRRVLKLALSWRL